MALTSGLLRGGDGVVGLVGCWHLVALSIKAEAPAWTHELVAGPHAHAKATGGDAVGLALLQLAYAL